MRFLFIRSGPFDEAFVAKVNGHFLPLREDDVVVRFNRTDEANNMAVLNGSTHYRFLRPFQTHITQDGHIQAPSPSGTRYILEHNPSRLKRGMVRFNGQALQDKILVHDTFDGTYKQKLVHRHKLVCREPTLGFIALNYFRDAHPNAEFQLIGFNFHEGVQFNILHDHDWHGEKSAVTAMSPHVHLFNEDTFGMPLPYVKNWLVVKKPEARQKQRRR